MKIKAAVLDRMGVPPPYASTKPLRTADVELAPPGRGEVLVRIGAAGLCHSDLSVIDGDRPRPMPMALRHERTVKGSYIGTCVPTGDIPRYVALYRGGKLPVNRLMSGKLRLDDINEGFDRLHDGTAVRQVIELAG